MDVQSRMEILHRPHSLGPSFVALTDTLKLNNNQLVGDIPISLGNLLTLEIIDLGFNQLFSSIPPILANYQLMSKYSMHVLTWDRKRS